MNISHKTRENFQESTNGNPPNSTKKSTSEEQQDGSSQFKFGGINTNRNNPYKIYQVHNQHVATQMDPQNLFFT